MDKDELGVSSDPFDPFQLSRQLTLVLFEQYLIICAVALNPYAWVPDYSVPLSVVPLMQQKTRLLLE